MYNPLPVCNAYWGKKNVRALAHSYLYTVFKNGHEFKSVATCLNLSLVHFHNMTPVSLRGLEKKATLLKMISLASMFEGDTCLCLFLLLVEEELARVRSAFVWRVSTEILKQLLEALVSDGVLNELEKESILEGNPVRADKARCFIDTVRKKGDKASRIMVRHLQTIDLSLFSQLRLYSDPSAQQGESTFLCSLLRCEV